MKKVEGSRFCITIGDIADEIVDDLDSVDHTLAQFLDILTSQHAIFDRLGKRDLFGDNFL